MDFFSGTPEYEVIYYDLPDGSYPVDEFIRSQTKKMRAKIYHNMHLLEERGPSLRLPYSDTLGDGILELRTIQGSNITRILYFFVVGKKIILTHGFTKKSQKTPTSEIERARKYRDDYLKRKGESSDG